MSDKNLILIVEDEKDISRLLRDYLTMNGYQVHTTENGKDALKSVETLSPNFIVLDIMLPDMDGIEVCRRIREKSDIPILVLSARGSDTDKVMGLGFGADDYMTKPFSSVELVARINAHLRRYESTASAPKGEGVIRAGDIVIDERAYTVSVNGKDVELSAKEFELLRHLAKNKNQVFSKSQLLDAIWGYEEYGDENTITVYVRRIREKIEADPSNPKYIKTVWGIGYKFSLN